MSTRDIPFYGAKWLSAWLLLFAITARAEMVRVTTWNLQPNIANGTNAWSPKVQQGQLQEAADTLRKLNPDVIVLQRVADWKMCDALVRALQPENYFVVVCSAFHDAPGKKLERGQVAILSRSKAYLSWTEGWQANGKDGLAGGFAFAAIHLGDKNAGIFSVQLGEDEAVLNKSDAAQQQARGEGMRQLIQKTVALRNWTTNRLDAVIVAGDFNTSADDARWAGEKTLERLTGFGFVNAAGDLPLAERVTLPGNQSRMDATVDYIFTKNAGRVETPQFFQAALTEHAAVTCDLDLGGMPAMRLVREMKETNVVANIPVPATPTTAKSEGTKEKTNEVAVNIPSSTKALEKPADSRKLAWLVGGFLLGGVVALVLIQLRMRQARVLRDTDGPPFVHIAMGTGAHVQTVSPRMKSSPEDVRAGVVAELARWLKGKFAQRLLSDRAELLATQQLAVRKMLAVDERLTKIEQRIELRNREYELRIDQLSKELAGAQEENRELIRAKIALVKAEMEKERLKAEQLVKGHQHN